MPPEEEVYVDEVGQLAKQALAPAVSKTAPLGANETFTSDVFNGSGYARVVGTVFADVEGTLYVEQSPDGTNWDVVEDITVGAGEKKGYTIEIVAPYIRVRYVNGPNPQTQFRLYAFLRVM